MKVKLGLFVLIVCVIGSVFLWQKSSFFKKELEQKPADEQEGRLDRSWDLQETVKGAKDLTAQIQDDSIDRIGNFIEEQKKEIAKQLLGNEQSEVKVIPKAIDETSQNQLKIITIDLAKENNLLFNLKRGDKIYLIIKNAKAGYCLYINDAKYTIVEDQSLEVEFLTSGTFSIKTNLCNLHYSEHGKIIVE